MLSPLDTMHIHSAIKVIRDTILQELPGEYHQTQGNIINFNAFTNIPSE